MIDGDAPLPEPGLLVSYDTDRCVGGAREHEACGRCIPACPHDAIARRPEEPTRVRVDVQACRACGACSAACPTGALLQADVDLPALLEAARRGLASSEAPWVLIHCGEEGRRLVQEQGDLGATVLALPCLRAASEALLLGLFAQGARGVALVGCAECPHGERAPLLERLEGLERVLAGVGLDGAPRLRRFAAGEEPDAEVHAEVADFAAALEPAPHAVPSTPFEARLPDEVVEWSLFLLERGLVGRPRPVALTTGAAFAFARVDPAACTLCGACATVCPPGAFRSRDTLDELYLDHRARSCVACGLCEAVCPETAIQLLPQLHLGDDARRHVPVARDVWARCPRCGRPVFSAKALAAIERQVATSAPPAGYEGEDPTAWLRLCLVCRGERTGRSI